MALSARESYLDILNFYGSFDGFKTYREQSGSTMSDDTITAEDPITGEEIELPADVEVGEIVDSPISGAELEVISLDPVTLEEAPELEEDWGE